MRLETFRTIITAVFIIVLASVEIVYFFILNLLTPIIGRKRIRSIKSYLTGVFLRMIRYFACDFKLILTGDIDLVDGTSKQKSIFLQNHQTELDWLFATYFYQVFNKEGDFSAVMKGSLSNIPTFGYAMQDLNMCFLERNWEKDRHNFDNFLECYLSHPRAVSVLMCPEGTTFTQGTYERSIGFADKTNRPHFNHLLLPRSMGLAYMIKTLRENSTITGEEFYIYDTTMQFEGYSGEMCDDNYERKIDVRFPSFDNIFWKRYPIVCHMHVSVTPISRIITDDVHDLADVNKTVEKWLDDVWSKKDDEMNYFISHQSFDTEWNENQRIENFNVKRRIYDSFEWVMYLIGAIIIDVGILYCLKRLIKFCWNFCF